MGRVGNIFFRLRWPLAGVWLAAFGIVGWWMLPESMEGANGLVGVMGFIPFKAWQGAVYHVAAIDMMVLLAMMLVFAVPRANARLVRVGPWKGKELASVSLVAAVVTMGWTAAVLEWTGRWAVLVDGDPQHLFDCTSVSAVEMLCAFWILWAAGLRLAPVRGDYYERLGALLKWMGLASAGLLAMSGVVLVESVRRMGPKWYAIYGSYTGLVLGTWAMLWTWGAAQARLHAARDYHRLARSGRADRSAEPAGPSLRYAMGPMLLGIYRIRLAIFTFVALLLTFSVWMLISDVAIRDPFLGLMFKIIDDWWHVWMIPEHMTRGMLGIYPTSRPMHWMVTFVELGLFVVTQWLFIRPRRRWTEGLMDGRRPGWLQCMACAAPAAALTVGVAATLWELHGGWYDLTKYYEPPIVNHQYPNMILEPTFWKSLPVLVVAWLGWVTVFRLFWRRGDGFYQRVQMLFWLFAAAGIELMAAGMIHVQRFGFVGEYYHRGTYTTAGIGVSVILWTLVPGLVLLYAGARYAVRRMGAKELEMVAETAEPDG